MAHTCARTAAPMIVAVLVDRHLAWIFGLAMATDVAAAANAASVCAASVISIAVNTHAWIKDLTRKARVSIVARAAMRADASPTDTTVDSEA